MSQKQYADMTEMVFEDRDRKYGAYRLRKLYNQRLSLATILGLGLFFAGISAPNLIKKEAIIIQKKTTEVCLDCLIKKPFPEEEKKKIDVPDLPPPRRTPPTIALLIPEPTPPDEIDQETDPTMPDLETLAAAPVLGLSDLEGEGEIFIEIPDEICAETKEQFELIDINPEQEFLALANRCPQASKYAQYDNEITNFSDNQHNLKLNQTL